MVATNIGNYLNTPYGYYPYSEPLAIDFLGLETYMIGKVVQFLGLETRQTKYNIGLFRILWQIGSDGIDASNYTASSSASVDKNVLNLKSDIIEQYWQTTSNTDQWFQFDAGSGHVIEIDTFALIGTNLTTSAVVKVYGAGGSGSAPPADWGTVPLLFEVISSNDPLEVNWIYIAPNNPHTGYRHFRVTVSDPTNGNSFIRIGRCIAGSSMIFTTENCFDTIGYKKENYKDTFKINGFTTISNNRAFKKTMKISFKDLNRIEYINYRHLSEYLNYCRDSLKALIIVDPTNPYQYSVFAKLKEMPTEEHQYICADTNRVGLELSYEEGT